MGKCRRKPKARFTFKIDEQLLRAMQQEHAQELEDERASGFYKKLAEQVVCGPVFAMKKAGVKKEDSMKLHPCRAPACSAQRPSCSLSP